MESLMVLNVFSGSTTTSGGIFLLTSLLLVLVLLLVLMDGGWLVLLLLVGCALGVGGTGAGLLVAAGFVACRVLLVAAEMSAISVSTDGGAVCPKVFLMVASSEAMVSLSPRISFSWDAFLLRASDSFLRRRLFCFLKWTLSRISSVEIGVPFIVSVESCEESDSQSVDVVDSDVAASSRSEGASVGRGLKLFFLRLFPLTSVNSPSGGGGIMVLRFLPLYALFAHFFRDAFGFLVLLLNFTSLGLILPGGHTVLR